MQPSLILNALHSSSYSHLNYLAEDIQKNAEVEKQEAITANE